MAAESSCLTNSEAMKLARECVSTGMIRCTRHCKERLQERGFDFFDVTRILEAGVVYRAPEFDVAHRNWRFRFEGKTIDGDDLVLIATFERMPNMTIVVTIFPED